MTPDIWPLIANDSACKALLGTVPRFEPFGLADDNTPKPYAVWQVVGGSPFNTLDCVPDADTFNVQIDVYATTATNARATAEAIRDAIQKNAYITSWRGEMREPSTKLYRYSFDALFFTKR